LACVDGLPLRKERLCRNKLAVSGFILMPTALTLPSSPMRMRSFEDRQSPAAITFTAPLPGFLFRTKIVRCYLDELNATSPGPR
jgi:hypothetical protein